MLSKFLYFINPRESTPGYHTMEVLQEWRIANAINVADLTGPTVAALLPSDWGVELCDERIQRLNYDTAASVIGITGKVTQRARMFELATEFRRRGKLVLIGGPHVTLNPDDMREHADILVRGEIEDIASGIFNDIAAGTWKREYIGEKPDLQISPVPRWDLYPRNIALAAQVQTSRGCPFECEFCDVIQYVGRKQRWKSPDQVILELEQLYVRGYRDVFFADDNLTVVRRRARELLERLAEWNNVRPMGRMRFSTQVSIDTARDSELLELCNRAGMQNVFIGIESPNADSLAEARKRQNLRVDLVEEVRKFVRAGIMVMGGMIVGFDHDGQDIFEVQASFIKKLPVPLVQLGLLVAPFATPLYARIRNEGRLIGDGNLTTGEMLVTNIRPIHMTLEQLQRGMRWLLNRVYSPQAFGDRLQAFVDLCPPASQAQSKCRVSRSEALIAQMIASLGTEERQLIRQFQHILQTRPDLHSRLVYILMGYAQVRHMLHKARVWDSDLGRQEFLEAA